MVAAIPLPYVLRRREGLRPHYLVAYAALAVGLLHSLLSITRAPLPIGAELGLWAGSLAAAVLIAQVLIGRDLRVEQGAGRGRVRRIHLAVMLTLVLLVALHLLLVTVHL